MYINYTLVLLKNMFNQRRKILLMIKNPTLRNKVVCSKELCKDCPNLDTVATCTNEECEIKRLKEKLCNDCCGFGL